MFEKNTGPFLLALLQLLNSSGLWKVSPYRASNMPRSGHYQKHGLLIIYLLKNLFFKRDLSYCSLKKSVQWLKQSYDHLKVFKHYDQEILEVFYPQPTKKEQMVAIYYFISFSLTSKINKHLYVQSNFNVNLLIARTFLLIQ